MQQQLQLQLCQVCCGVPCCLHQLQKNWAYQLRARENTDNLVPAFSSLKFANTFATPSRDTPTVRGKVVLMQLLYYDYVVIYYLLRVFIIYIYCIIYLLGDSCFHFITCCIIIRSMHADHVLYYSTVQYVLLIVVRKVLTQLLRLRLYDYYMICNCIYHDL